MAVWNSSSRWPRGISRYASYLPLARPDRSALGVLTEAAPVRRHDATAGRDVLAEMVERLQHVHVGQYRLGHDEGELLSGRQRLDDLAGLGSAVRRTQVVVACVAAELVEQVVGVLLRDQQDHGAVVHTESLGPRTS